MTPVDDIERMWEIRDCGPVEHIMGLFVRGHISTLAMRLAVAAEYADDYRTATLRREWWRDMPLGIFDPEMDCGGEPEPTVFAPCRRIDVGAYPVTVVYL